MEPSQMFGIAMVSALVVMALTVVAYILDTIFGNGPEDVDGDVRDEED